ncbi:mycofactocin-coupled SDR family oxidoreductase [Prauserella oleivorans]|uniref:Mycofactocin-coupled SDR family oxidoreductase n=1 Tax=Prauserella oleivorans TaxID=1478153 RepID=A0ABW5WBL0_9PSEU
MGKLDGKVAFVTGAARGQGREHALALAREGADIIGIDIARDIATVPYSLATEQDLKATGADVEALGRRALFVKADVRNTADLDDVVARGIRDFGKIDIVVANAGIYSQDNFWEMSEEKWQDMIDVNLTGVWRSVKAVAPHLIERQEGSVVLTASVNGFQPGYQLSHYVASKHAVVGLTKNFANELAPYGVRVNAVAPGAIDTTMLNNPPIYERFAGNPNGTREDAWESVRHFHLLKDRSMLPSEAVSKAIVWLVSDDAEHITGIALPVDAGHLAMDGYNPYPFK